jgi:hypothetical protein
VREYLSSFQLTELISPALPTRVVGGALIRLRITSPDVEFDLPVLRYFVGSAQSTDRVTVMALHNPIAGGEISFETEFNWQSVQAAEYYRYECFDNSGLTGYALSGAVTSGNDTSLRVPRAVMEHLVPGERYWCQTVAIDESGRRMAQSKVVVLFAR